jgi:hypothetical protein
MINAFNIVCYNSKFCKLNSDNPIKQFEISLPSSQRGLGSRFMIPVLDRSLVMHIRTLLKKFNHEGLMVKSRFLWVTTFRVL